MDIEWWMWLAAGVGLALAELMIASFYALWFGLGALVVALLVALNPGFPLVAQLSIWGLASVAMTVAWLKFFPRGDKTRAGTSGEFIGEIGLLVASVQPFECGRVRFQRPILGSDSWDCVSDTAIQAGERVRLVSVEGSFLKVSKTKEQ